MTLQKYFVGWIEVNPVALRINPWKIDFELDAIDTYFHAYHSKQNLGFIVDIQNKLKFMRWVIYYVF